MDAKLSKRKTLAQAQEKPSLKPFAVIEGLWVKGDWLSVKGYWLWINGYRLRVINRNTFSLERCFFRHRRGFSFRYVYVQSTELWQCGDIWVLAHKWRHAVITHTGPRSGT